MRSYHLLFAVKQALGSLVDVLKIRCFVLSGTGLHLYDVQGLIELNAHTFIQGKYERDRSNGLSQHPCLVQVK